MKFWHVLPWAWIETRMRELIVGLPEWNFCAFVALLTKIQCDSFAFCLNVRIVSGGIVATFKNFWLAQGLQLCQVLALDCLKLSCQNKPCDLIGGGQNSFGRTTLVWRFGHSTMAGLQKCRYCTMKVTPGKDWKFQFKIQPLEVHAKCLFWLCEGRRRADHNSSLVYRLVPTHFCKTGSARGPWVDEPFLPLGWQLFAFGLPQFPGQAFFRRLPGNIAKFRVDLGCSTNCCTNFLHWWDIVAALWKGFGVCELWKVCKSGKRLQAAGSYCRWHSFAEAGRIAVRIYEGGNYFSNQLLSMSSTIARR